MTKPIGKQLVDQILALPNAPILVSEAKAILEDEERRRREFYNEISEYEKAEFINGEIIIHSPVKKSHNDVTAFLSRLLTIYVSKHNLGYVGIEKIMIRLTRNDYEPDICFFNQKVAKSFKATQSLFPAPNLVVEILSKRTAKNDRGVKFQDYQNHGVEEYWIIDSSKKTIEQYRLDENKIYQLIFKGKKGILHSTPIKGFSIEVAAIFNEAKNLAALQQILSS